MVSVVANVVGCLHIIIGAIGCFHIRAIEYIVGPTVLRLFRTSIPTSDACRVAFQRIKAFKREAFGVVFAFADADLSTRAFLHRDLNRSHHSLTRELVESRLPVIENIPLTIDLADAAMRVTASIGRSDDASLLVGLACTAINNGAAIGPRAQWMVAICIGERVVGFGQRELTVGRPPTVDKHVFILDLSDGRCLEEAELARLVLR